MLLYHFTSEAHLPHIRAAGVLLPVESNLDARVAHFGPDVVWLLDTPTVDYPHGLTHPLIDKTAVRFTIDTDRLPRGIAVTRWVDWPPAQQMDDRWRQSLLSAAGGEAAAAHWWVAVGRVRRSAWVEVARMDPLVRSGIVQS